MQLRDYDKEDLEEVFCLNFVAVSESWGETIYVDLKVMIKVVINQ